jgi:O-antigen ligase
MLKSGIFGERTAGERGGMALLPFSSIFPLLAIVMAVLLGGIIGRRDASTGEFIAGAILFVLVLILSQYELAVVMIIAAHIYVDWYLGLEIVGLTATVALLFFFFLARSSRYPWKVPRSLLLWCLLLVLTISPALRGAQSRYDLAYYYGNIFFGALVMFWLGMLIASNSFSLSTLFHTLAMLGALLAIHSMIQAMTGTVLFGSTRFDAFLAQVSNFELANSSAQRVGSFFENPDWNGTFFAVMLFLPIGFFVRAPSILQKLLYLVEIFLMSVALLFTYSIGAWVGALAGLVAFVLFVGRRHYRLLIPVLAIIIGMMLVIFFPAAINLLFQHISEPTEVSLRVGAWQTAIQVIRAFPLTGVGLGLTNYLQRAEPYRVPAQYLPLAHPHNAYLEVGAMAGLPVLLVFIALQGFTLWQAWRNWKQADAGTRSLLAGGIAAITALSINSLSINGWTLPPLAAVGWLILGAMASPSIKKKHPAEKESDIQL